MLIWPFSLPYAFVADLVTIDVWDLHNLRTACVCGRWILERLVLKLMITCSSPLQTSVSYVFRIPRGVLNCFHWFVFTRLGRSGPLVSSNTWQYRPLAHRPRLLLRIYSDWAGFVCSSGHQKKSPGDAVWVSVPVETCFVWLWPVLLHS